MPNRGGQRGAQEAARGTQGPPEAKEPSWRQTLLKTCNPPPPPGATEQYPGDNRLGNNYTPMPGVNWYKSSYNNAGPYHIKVIDSNHNKKQ